jgi:hypothetical protein
MAQFLNKLDGRKYSSDPTNGIPIAKEIINDENSHRDDLFNAVCYLGYRVLDGTYNEIDFIYPKILMCAQMSNTDLTKNSIRWEISFGILLVYFKLLIAEEKEISTNILNKIFDEKYITGSPRQIVNVVRAGSMLSCHYLFTKNKTAFEKCIERVIYVYQSGIKNYDILPKNYNTVIWEWYESMDALSVVRELKIFDDSFGKSITIEKLLKKWNAQANHVSLGPFYKSLILIYTIDSNII